VRTVGNTRIRGPQGFARPRSLSAEPFGLELAIHTEAKNAVLSLRTLSSTKNAVAFQYEFTGHAFVARLAKEVRIRLYIS
jgi:hypothetical protein